MAELIQAGGNILCSKIHNLLILYEIRRNCQSSGKIYYLPIYKKDDKTHCSSYKGISLLLHMNFNPVFLTQG
jgi:hypothetical protein